MEGLTSLPDCLREYAMYFTYIGMAVMFYFSITYGLWMWRYFKMFVLSPVLGLGVDLKTLGEWAVVTGATDGIGKAYAKQLAKKGMKVVIISRTLKKLQETAKEIEDESGSKVKYIVTDFTQGQEIYDNIRKELEGLDIGVLVNNVGMAPHLPVYYYQRTDIEFIRQIVDVNCHSVTMMTQMVLPRMVAKGKGAIVNNASGSAYCPAPTVAVYTGTKAFIDFFSRAVMAEVRGTGVIVQAVLPFYVATKMVAMGASPLAPTPEKYVRSQLATIGLSERTTGYWTHEPQGALLPMLPTRLREKMFIYLLQWITDAREKTK